MQGDSLQTRVWRQQQREQLIASRQLIVNELRQQWQQHVDSQILEHLTPFSSGIAGFYLPIRGELDCRSLAELLIERGWRMAVPVMQPGVKTLIFCEWTSDTKMTKGIWNIPIPETLNKVTPEVLIIPLVGFDRSGFRLGYGGGYYDRTLAAMQYQPLTIGIGLEQGEYETIYPHQYDIAMDLIITESRVQITI